MTLTMTPAQQERLARLDTWVSGKQRTQEEKDYTFHTYRVLIMQNLSTGNPHIDGESESGKRKRHRGDLARCALLERRLAGRAAQGRAQKLRYATRPALQFDLSKKGASKGKARRRIKEYEKAMDELVKLSGELGLD